MRPAAIIKVEVSADRCAGLADAVVGSQIHLLVFDAAPQPLDEDVVPPGRDRVDYPSGTKLSRASRPLHTAMRWVSNGALFLGGAGLALPT